MAHKRMNIGVKSLDSIFDPLFGDPPPDDGSFADRGYSNEREMAEDERVQRSRAAQTFFNNDHRDGENI